jgi:predicted transcriptional regulator of viral defense system
MPRKVRTQKVNNDGRAARALARSGLDVIRVPEDFPTLAEHGFPEVERVGVEPLKRLGLVRPAARGLYEVRDPRGVARSSFEKLLAARFAGTPHLVTGWWVLALAGLTNQDVKEVVVLTTTNRRSLTISGRRVRVAKVGPADLWGGEKRKDGLVIARPERAFCDCAGTRPARIPAARIGEALEAYVHSTPNSIARLARAAKRTNSPVVARRLGYLVELIAGSRAAEPLHKLIGVSRKADALDAGDEHSPIVTRWQIRTRLGQDELLEHRTIS